MKIMIDNLVTIVTMINNLVAMMIMINYLVARGAHSTTNPFTAGPHHRAVLRF